MASLPCPKNSHSHLIVFNVVSFWCSQHTNTVAMGNIWMLTDTQICICCDFQSAWIKLHWGFTSKFFLTALQNMLFKRREFMGRNARWPLFCWYSLSHIWYFPILIFCSDFTVYKQHFYFLFCTILMSHSTVLCIDLPFIIWRLFSWH